MSISWDSDVKTQTEYGRIMEFDPNCYILFNDFNLFFGHLVEGLKTNLASLHFDLVVATLYPSLDMSNPLKTCI